MENPSFYKAKTKKKPILADGLSIYKLLSFLLLNHLSLGDRTASSIRKDDDIHARG